MTIRVERAEETPPTDDQKLAKAIASLIKHKQMVSCEVELLPYGERPRSERKTRRMFDNRRFE